MKYVGDDTDKYLIILSFPSISIIQKENVRAWSGEQSIHRGPKSSCRNQGSERYVDHVFIRLEGEKMNSEVYLQTLER
jgi:hypothetical protein